MRKSSTFLLFLFWLLVLLSPNFTAQTTLIDEKEGVESLLLEREVLIFCPYRVVEDCNLRKPTINVSTALKDSAKKNLDYYYFVTGGKIIGKGANVIWDFADEKP